MISQDEKSVFISYRRSVSSYVARAVFQDLRANGYDVFMDVENIDAGTFDTIILNQITARAHFLIICTPGTFDRCNEPDDWLRREIEMAIAQGRNIVPLMVSDFKFKDNLRYLTGQLSGLPRLSALALYHEYFDECMARLRNRYLKKPVAGALLPTPQADQKVVAEKIEHAAAQPSPTQEELTAEGLFYRALARAEKDLEGKIADYSQAINLNLEYAAAYNNRGNARNQKGDLQGAIDDYTRSIQYRNPELELPYYNRGLAFRRMGDLEGAISDFTEAIRLEPKYIGAYFHRGVAHRKRGELDEAISDLTRAIQLDPKHASAYFNRALVNQTQGNLEEAIADFTEAINLNLQDAGAYYYRGVAFFAALRYQEACQDFTAALKPQPNAPITRAGLAIAQRMLDRKKEAVSGWRSLVKSDPRYRDTEWVGKQFSWPPEMVEAARSLITEMGS